MFSLRPLAGVILTSALLTGYAAAPAAASVQESAVVSQPRRGRATERSSITASAAERGVLKIKNGTGKDGVVTLVRGKSKAFSLYVRAKSTASFKRVDDGTYTVYFTYRIPVQHRQAEVHQERRLPALQRPAEVQHDRDPVDHLDAHPQPRQGRQRLHDRRQPEGLPVMIQG